jgi:hypothetical protein
VRGALTSSSFSSLSFITPTPSHFLSLALTFSFLINKTKTKTGRGFTISGNLKSFEGLVQKCRGSRKCRASSLNELVIHEIRNNASAIFENFFSAVVK